ncbi:MAG: hypothetical protein K9I85_00080 [Saprospiraceae bacterium]|nr:hypothetical protein [Saprospiraceae bacterium]
MKKSRWNTFRRRSRLIWLIIFGAIAVTVSTAMFSKRDAVAKEVIIEIKPMKDGGSLLTMEEVRTLLEARFPSKDPERLSKIPLRVLEETINAHPMVQHADIYVDARNRVRVRIEQPEPLIRIIDDRGANYYLDAQGMRIPISRHFTPRIMVATGKIPSYRDSVLQQPNHILSQLVLLGQTVQDDPFMAALIEQVDVRNGDLYLIPKMGKFKILLGDVSDLESKFSRLKSFYRHILPTAGWSKYALVNLAFKNQIVCRKA